MLPWKNIYAQQVGTKIFFNLKNGVKVLKKNNLKGSFGSLEEVLMEVEVEVDVDVGVEVEVEVGF